MKQTDRKKGLLQLSLFLIFMVILTFAAGKPIIRAVSDPEAFRLQIEKYGWAGRLIFLLMIFTQTVIAFIPGEPLEIAAGYAFGAWEGTFLCLAGQGLGSVCVFLFVKKFGMRAVSVFVSEEKIASLRFLKDEKRLNALVFFLFLTPGTPKDALCYFIALTPMKLAVWAFLSTFARTPSVITSTFGGNALGSGKIQSAVFLFLITFLISAAGYLLFGRYLKRKSSGKKSS